MFPGISSNATNRRPSGNDRSGERRFLNIQAFASSHFPAVLAGASYLVDVTLPARPGRNGAMLAERVITVERCPVISQRETLEGEKYLAYSDENIDIRFMPLRDEPIVGLDATENGEKITVAQLTQKVSEDFTAYLAARPAPVAEGDLDELPI